MTNHPTEWYNRAMRIETPQNWWKVVELQWDNLLSIIADQMNLSHLAYKTPGDADSPTTGRSILQEITRLRKIHDPKLARYFHAAWGLASDAYAWSVPGWGSLCDLCSEEWALYESENCEENLPAGK